MTQDRIAQRQMPQTLIWSACFHALPGLLLATLLLGLLIAPEAAFAQAAGSAQPAPDPTNTVGFLNGAALSWHWSLPFLGLLATIALGPSLFPRVWRAHYGKLAFFWGTIAIAPLGAIHGVPPVAAELVRTVLTDYASFMVLLFALYVVAGGILVTGNLRGTPLTNAVILACGTALASIIGTIGAAMLLIRPLIRANAHRLHNVHVIVFFIFLAGNVGGALSWYGDPPLYAGFQRGVAFFWTTENIVLETAIVAGALLVVFIMLDLVLFLRDRRIATVGESTPPRDLRVRGRINILLIAMIIGTLYISAAWDSGISFDLRGSSFTLQQILRDVLLLAVAIASLVLTREEHREINGFSWEPIGIVAVLFAVIFVCLIPVLAMMRAGPDGAFDWVMNAAVGDPGGARDVATFWVTGLTSAVISNVPGYLVFFDVSGANAAALMNAHASTLAAISMGAVYMGALTYIGNAPNYVVYSIALERGIKMPGFFGYLLWSGVVLVPIFVLVSYVFAGWI